MTGKIFLVIALFSTCLVDTAAHEGGVLRVAGWDVYGDPGKQDKVIGYRSFEEKYKVSIEFTPLRNLDEIIDLAESDQHYDVLIISNEGISLLEDMGLVQALDLKQLPHYANLHHRLRYTDWGLFDGKIYAVPWAWGPTGLLYDADALDRAPDSWNQLWDPAYKGKVALWNDVSLIWTAALALGYTNVYSLTREQLSKVKDKLLALNHNVYGYYSGEEEELDFILNHDVVMLNSWFDPSRRLQQHGKRLQMVIPREGAVGMFDSYLISSKSHQSKLAHQFIDHQITPSIQYKMVQITGLSPANTETLELMSHDEIKALHLDQADYFGRMLLWDHMPRKHLYEQVLSEIRKHAAH